MRLSQTARWYLINADPDAFVAPPELRDRLRRRRLVRVAAEWVEVTDRGGFARQRFALTERGRQVVAQLRRFGALGREPVSRSR